jgi:hypothetical protein
MAAFLAQIQPQSPAINPVFLWHIDIQLAAVAA